MTRKSRYLLLALGFLVFIIGAPLIVLYLRGLSFDIKSGQLISTGILAVRNEPKDAQIFIDDKLKREKEGDIKFLKPGEYNLSLKKAGFFDWSKRVVIKPNEVTWAQGSTDKIHLIYEVNSLQTLIHAAKDYYIFDDQLMYVNENTLTLASLRNPQNQRIVELPAQIDKLQASPGNNLLLLSNQNTNTHLLLNITTQEILDISSLISSNSILKFSGSNELYALEAGSLYKILAKEQQKNLFKEDVSQFTFVGNTIYYIKNTPTDNFLAAGDINLGDEQKIISRLPKFLTSEIIINFQKEIFIIGDGILYKVGSELSKMAEGVSQWHFGRADSGFVIVHSGELSFYNNQDRRLNLITRSSLPFTQVILVPELNYALFVREGKLVALEIDSRGQQNEYTLYESSKITKFFIDDGKKNIFLLDDGAIKTLRIR